MVEVDPNRKVFTFSLRISHNEKKALEEKAKKAGKSVSQYLIDRGLDRK